MEIEYREGDMFTAPERMLLHGCNAQGVMGSGVAKAMRETYPGAYDAYVLAHRYQGLRLGEIVWYTCKADGRTIANAITQDRYGRDGSRYVDYEAVGAAIARVNYFCVLSQLDLATSGGVKIDSVAMPLIGAGLGGGDWKVISRIVEQASPSFRPVVYLHDGKMPA